MKLAETLPFTAISLAVFIAFFSTTGVSGEAAGPRQDDLWDISQGAVVTRASPVAFGFDAQDIFGGKFSSWEPGHTVFADHQPEGVVHFIEWRTAKPVRLGEFALYAAGDGPIYSNQREFKEFVLKAKSLGSDDFDVVLYSYTPTHPYSFEDPETILVVRAAVGPIRAQEFRAEFHQYNSGRSFDGPRITELDGFPPSCEEPIPSGLVAWWPGQEGAMDVIGGNHGEEIGKLEVVEGLVGQAFEFGQSAGYLMIPPSESFNVESFTIEAWVHPSRVDQPQPIFEFASSAGQVGVSLWHSKLAGNQGEQTGSGSGSIYANVRSEQLEDHVLVSAPNLLEEKAWSHVALTYHQESGVAALFHNGVVVAEEVWEAFVPQTQWPLYIGKNPADSTEPGGKFLGIVDEISIYKRALAPREIQGIYDLGENGKCLNSLFTLKAAASVGGTIALPGLPYRFEPGTQVTIFAFPDEGFRFAGWFGDLDGKDNPITIQISKHTVAEAYFEDVAAPSVEIESPIPGSTSREIFTLRGRASDNAGVTSLVWKFNGEDRGLLPILNGGFLLENLRLQLGENEIVVIALDAAGHETKADVVVTWDPDQVLKLAGSEPRQEGQELQVPIILKSTGKVGGMTFIVRYNREYLAEPQLFWSGAVASALNQVNYAPAGEVRGAFALPALNVPAGEQEIGHLIFRTRSVPSSLQTELRLAVVDVSDAAGNPIVGGTAVQGAAAAIRVRRVTGDNNANHRLDIGDATIMQRLLTGLQQIRPWDHALNDVNSNRQLDSGDVIRVLRAAVGIDPQPEAPSLAPASFFSLTPDRGVRASAPFPQAVGRVALNASALRAEPGELITVQVRVAELNTSISAAAFTLEYPVDSLRLLNAQSHRAGNLVPGEAVVMWNVAPFQNDYAAQSGFVSMAASSPNPWPASEGVLAEFVFQVMESQATQQLRPIRVSNLELTPNGFELFSLPGATLQFMGRELPGSVFDLQASRMTADGFELHLNLESGRKYLIEASSDLVEWVALGVAEGANSPVILLDNQASGKPQSFYRGRPE